MVVRRTSAGPRPLRKPMRISPNVALRAESRVRENPFQLSKQLTALHPPGVGMAMDDGAYTSLSGFSNWSYNNFASMAAEGQIFLGYPTLAAMGQRNENAVAVTTIADDMTRKWIRLKGQAGLAKQDRIDEINDKFDAIALQANMKVWLIQAFQFGRGHLYLDTGDTDDREELKTDLGFGARSATSALKMPGKELLAVRPVEPVWVSPHDYETSNPLKPNWYKPAAWHVMSNQIHASRLVTVIPFPVSDLFKPAYSFGGMPMLQMGRPYVENWLNTRQAVADIVRGYSIFVLKTNMQSVLTGAEDSDLIKRVAMFNKYRNKGGNEGAFLIDKDTEDFGNVSANLSGIDALQAAAQEHMAAAWRIPLVNPARAGRAPRDRPPHAPVTVSTRLSACADVLSTPYRGEDAARSSPLEGRLARKGRLLTFLFCPLHRRYHITNLAEDRNL